MEDSNDNWYAFCGFNASAPNFFNKFIYAERDKIITPCAEFFFVVFCYFIFLFFIVLGYFHINNSARIPTLQIRLILIYKLGMALTTSSILMFLLTFGASSSPVNISSVLLVEYGLALIIWGLYTIIWIQTINYNAWTRPLGMSVAYGLVSATFVFVFTQRYVKYGIWDRRCYPILIILILHIFNYVFCAFEFIYSKKYRNLDRSFDASSTDNDAEIHETDEDANIISRIFFWWTNKLVQRGYRGEIKQVDDLYKLPSSLRIMRVEREFFEAAPTQFTDARPFSFAHALFRAYGCGYLLLGAQSFISDVTKFAGPILLHLLIKSLDQNVTDKFGYVYATLMLASTLISAVTACSYNFYARKISLKVRGALSTAVYDKLLQTSTHRLLQFSTGQLINFMSTDVERIADFCTSFHAVWSMPMNLAIALYLLYREVGLAFSAGLAVALITIPINKWIAIKIGDMSKKMMHFKDLRMRIVTEIAQSIRMVKLNNWDSFFIEKVEQIREQELHYLRARKYLDAVCVYLWASAPILVTITILVTYTLVMEEQLTATKVFTSIALVNILIVPLNAFPWVLNSMVEAIVSKQRFDRFFAIESMDLFALYRLTDVPQCQLQIDNTRFSWADGQSFVGPINIRALKGMLIGVMGPVGSGKSTLLLGILGETIGIADKSVRVRQSAVTDGFAYFGQACWLQRGTIRDNILCGSAMRAEFYAEVLCATALDYDIKLMPDKDEHVIGDDGTTLSGGQRARLALARAVYQENDVVLLDDPFASLDDRVAEFVYKNCIEAMLLHRGKTVILCTHHVQHLRNADYIICLNKNGTVRKEGLPFDVLSLLADELVHMPAISSTIGTSDDSSSGGDTLFDDADRPPALADELKEGGTVKFSVYWKYFGAVGTTLSALILASLFAMQATKNGSDVWLSRWTLNRLAVRFTNRTDWSYLYGERELQPLDVKKVEEYSRTIYFLAIYVCVALFNTVFTLIRAFLFAYGGVVAAEKIHCHLLHRVLHSTISWWDETPVGRVVNRLCSDVYTVDDSLPFQLNICLASLFNLIGALFITTLALPFLLLPVGVLLVLYYLIQRYYRFANCEIKRIMSVTLSPLYSHVTDTVMGLVTIRAHRFGERFAKMLRDRLDQNLRAQYSALAASQWLAVRLQLLGVVLVSAVSYAGVTESRYLSMETALIGLAITYSLSLTNTLSSLLCSFIDTEKEMISVERVADYIFNVPQEPTNFEVENIDKFPLCRMVRGQIDFTCVSLRYGKSLALKNVTFCIEAGQRVAIIGRTGAGKSSIFQALLRAHPIETGKIYIDGGTVDIMKMNPRAVRSIFGFISQTPFIFRLMFSGTIRENLTLDNAERLDDATIMLVIAKAGLAEWLTRCGGLNTEVTEGGRNFSYGEKQILGVCRLILARPRIVLIDEATAHMDETKHLEMMDLIRTHMPDTTILSIVHRTVGLDRFDWIIELSDGMIRRQGRPSAFCDSIERTA